MPSPNRAYHYDANGRMDCRGASTAACTGGNRIEWFVGGGVREVNNGPLKSVFTYGGPDRRRVRQTVSHASLPTAAQNRTITYVGAHFEVETEQATGKSRYRLSAFAGGRAVYQRVETIVSNAAQAPEAYYLHRDHLGSVDRLSPAISGGSGVTAYSFDAFGGRRGTNWQADSTTYGQNHWTDRGYTGHEHLDDVELIHMNGRVQHPGLGRFLSPDPLLGDPANPQTLNRYAYVSNNPLAFTDPSGFAQCPDGSPIDCVDVCIGCSEQSGGQGGGVWSTTPPPPGDVGGGFTVQESPSRGDPGQAQQAGRDGSGLTRSEQEGVKAYLDAYARLRGTSGGVIFFGNRSQMGFLAMTGGARELLKDRRAGLNFAGSMALAMSPNSSALVALNVPKALFALGDFAFSTAEAASGMATMGVSYAAGPAAPVTFQGGAVIYSLGILGMRNSGIALYNAVNDTQLPGVFEGLDLAAGGDGRAGRVADYVGGLRPALGGFRAFADYWGWASAVNGIDDLMQ